MSKDAQAAMRTTADQSRHPNLWPPFTQIESAALPQRVIAGDGALLLREQGIPLIDAISSWWVTLHGHGHPVMAKAIADPVSYTHLTLPTRS